MSNFSCSSIPGKYVSWIVEIVKFNTPLYCRYRDISWDSCRNHVKRVYKFQGLAMTIEIVSDIG